jgi:hypothetical protein
MSDFDPIPIVVDPRSHESISSALGVGLAVEFVKDSPLFRQNVSAFQNSFSHFSPYCENLAGALKDYTSALSVLETAQSNLRIAIDGNNIQNDKSKQSYNASRSLFTNSMPNLGDLNETLNSLKKMLETMNASVQSYRVGIQQEITPIIEKLAKDSNLEREQSLLREMQLKKEQVSLSNRRGY